MIQLSDRITDNTPNYHQNEIGSHLHMHQEPAEINTRIDRL